MDHFITSRHINSNINYTATMSSPSSSASSPSLRNGQKIEKNKKLLSIREGHLLKILYSRFDQPLNISNNDNRENGDDEESLQSQRPLITSTSQRYSNVSDENMPPSEFISGTQRQTEGYLHFYFI